LASAGHKKFIRIAITLVTRYSLRDRKPRWGNR
jgi:hypothetical protein